MAIKKILHIDDEPYEVNGIKVALEDKGYDVDQFAWPYDAENPEEEGSFTELPDFSNYDLIMVDIIMGPGSFGLKETDKGYTTGLVFHKKLFVDKSLNMPVFFISALPDGPFQLKARQYATQNNIPFIRKSVETVEEIIRHINIWDNEDMSGGVE